MDSPKSLLELCATVVGQQFDGEFLNQYQKSSGTKKDSKYIDDYLMLMIQKHSFPINKGRFFGSVGFSLEFKRNLNESVVENVMQMGNLLSGNVKETALSDFENILIEFEKGEIVKSTCSSCVLREDSICIHGEILCTHRVYNSKQVKYKYPIQYTMDKIGIERIRIVSCIAIKSKLDYINQPDINLNNLVTQFEQSNMIEYSTEDKEQIYSELNVDDQSTNVTLWCKTLDRLSFFVESNRMFFSWIPNVMESNSLDVFIRITSILNQGHSHYITIYSNLIIQKSYYHAGKLAIKIIKSLLDYGVPVAQRYISIFMYLLKIFVEAANKIIIDPGIDSRGIMEDVQEILDHQLYANIMNKQIVMNYWTGDVSLEQVINGSQEANVSAMNEIRYSLAMGKCPRNVAREIFAHRNNSKFIENDFPDEHENIYLTSFRLMISLRPLSSRYNDHNVTVDRIRDLHKLSIDLLYHLASGIAVNIAQFSILDGCSDIEAYNIEHLFPKSDFKFPEEAFDEKKFNRIQCTYYLLVFVDAIIEKIRHQFVEDKFIVTLISLCLISLEHSRIILFKNSLNLLFRNRYDWNFLIKSIMTYLTKRRGILSTKVTEEKYLDCLQNKPEFYVSNIPPYELLYCLLFCYREYVNNDGFITNNIDRSARLNVGKCSANEKDFDAFLESHPRYTLRLDDSDPPKIPIVYIGDELVGYTSSAKHQDLFNVFRDILMSNKYPFENCEMYKLHIDQDENDEDEDVQDSDDFNKIYFYKETRWFPCCSFLKVAKVYVSVAFADKNYFAIIQFFNYLSEVDMTVSKFKPSKHVAQHLSFMRKSWFNQTPKSHMPTFAKLASAGILQLERVEYPESSQVNGMRCSLRLQQKRSKLEDKSNEEIQCQISEKAPISSENDSDQSLVIFKAYKELFSRHNDQEKTNSQLQAFKRLKKVDQLEHLKISIFSLEIALQAGCEKISRKTRQSIDIHDTCMSMGPASLLLFKEEWEDNFVYHKMESLISDLKTKYPMVNADKLYSRVEESYRSIILIE